MEVLGPRRPWLAVLPQESWWPSVFQCISEEFFSYFSAMARFQVKGSRLGFALSCRESPMKVVVWPAV